MLNLGLTARLSAHVYSFAWQDRGYFRYFKFNTLPPMINYCLWRPKCAENKDAFCFKRILVCCRTTEYDMKTNIGSVNRSYSTYPPFWW